MHLRAYIVTLERSIDRTYRQALGIVSEYYYSIREEAIDQVEIR
jgi:hypothetical protein